MLFFYVCTADIMIKPDGVQRGLIGEIISRFEQKGYKLVAMKLTAPGREHMEKHYADLSSKGFFAGLISYMTSGPVCAMVWEGKNVVLEGRKMLGATMPSESAMGTIRCGRIIFLYFVFNWLLCNGSTLLRVGIPPPIISLSTLPAFWRPVRYPASQPASHQFWLAFWISLITMRNPFGTFFGVFFF